MAIETRYFRHVWRLVTDGNTGKKIRVLALQQWFRAQSWDSEIHKNGGYWEDVPIAEVETTEAPYVKWEPEESDG